MRYKVIQSRHWKNTKTGQTASIYGACPWTSDADKVNWTKELVGWTWEDTKNGTIGIGRRPVATLEEAEEVANKLNGGPGCIIEFYMP